MDDVVAALEAAYEASDEDDRDERRFVRRDPVSADALAAVEARLGFALPPSLKEFVEAHGLFRLGEEESSFFYVDVWPTDEWNTAVAYYADQLECDPTVDEVADAIGMEPGEVEGLAHAVIIGSGEDEDLLAFDLRTRNDVGECEFYRMRLDDTEIEYVTNLKSKPVEGRGLDAWLLKVAKRWS